jgi:hypothetical protein
VWFQDEMRVGQKNMLTYRWATKGLRLRAVHDQSTYVFGTVCPARGAGAALGCPGLQHRSHAAASRQPQENIWQFMRQNWLSNRVFKSFDDIVDHCCYV